MEINVPAIKMLSTLTVSVLTIQFQQVKRINRVSYQEYKQQCKNELTPSQIKYTIFFFQILHYYIQILYYYITITILHYYIILLYWNPKLNKVVNKFSSLQYRYLFMYLFIFDYMVLSVCVKDKTCLRTVVNCIS